MWGQSPVRMLSECNIISIEYTYPTKDELTTTKRLHITWRNKSSWDRLGKPANKETCIPRTRNDGKILKRLQNKSFKVLKR